MKSYFKYTILISSILLLLFSKKIVTACADFYDYWNENTLGIFQPNIVNNNEKNELYYLTSNFLNTDINKNNDGRELKVAFNQSVDDWYLHLNKAVQRDAIAKFLDESNALPIDFDLKLDNTNFIASYYASEPLIQYLLKQKMADELNYLIIAKCTEAPEKKEENPWTSFYYDYYNLNESTGAKIDSVQLVNAIGKALKSTKDEFFIQRYAFQLMRYYRYNGGYTNTIDLYNQYFANMPDSYLRNWAMNYFSDALVATEKYAEASYYSSILFDKATEKNKRAFSKFSGYEKLEDVLQYCTNDHERAMVHVISAFKSFKPTVAIIKTIYKLDPNNCHLQDLLVREINKLDGDLVSEQNIYFSYEYGDNTAKEKGGKALMDFVKSLYAKNDAQKPFYTLCMAHLSLLSKNYDLTKSYLQEIKDSKELNQTQQLQWLITQTLLMSQYEDLRSDNGKNALAEWLSKLIEQKNNIYNSGRTMDVMFAIIANKFISQLDNAHAYLFRLQFRDEWDVERFLNESIRPQDIDTIFAYIDKPNNRLDALLKSYLSIDRAFLNKVQGSLFMRQNKPELALQSFAKLNEPKINMNLDAMQTEPDGPSFHVYNYTDTPYSKKALQFSHYDFVNNILKLKADLKNNRGDKASNYYKLASLYMEMSFYGRAYNILQYNGNWTWYEYENVAEDKQRGTFADHYYGCLWALPYYRLALKHSHNKELSAKCTYALFRANRHWQRYAKSTSEKDIDYLYQLHDKYKNTEYYKIKECWGLSAYVAELRNPRAKKE
jgi:hypothetical protein